MTAQLPAPAPVQRRAEGTAAPDGEHVHAAAAHGTSGGASELPHRATIQQLFGRHDVSQIRAHIGGVAADGATAMGAKAYATGEQIAFAAPPDLHTAAHEAAHVVQQRAGVQLQGGVGQVGDIYERHADAVADRVVAGQPAEDLLDHMVAGGGGGGRAVQRVRITVDRKTFETANKATAELVVLRQQLIERRAKLAGNAQPNQGARGNDVEQMSSEELHAAILGIEQFLRDSAQNGKSRLCGDLAATREAAEAEREEPSPSSSSKGAKAPRKPPVRASSSKAPSKKGQGVALAAAHVAAVVPFLVEFSEPWIDAQTALNRAGASGIAQYVDVGQAVDAYVARIREPGEWGDVAEADAIARNRDFYCEILQADAEGTLYLAATIGDPRARTRHARKLFHNGVHYMVLTDAATAGQPAPDDQNQALVFQNPAGDGDCLYASLQILIGGAPIVQGDSEAGRETATALGALREEAAANIDREKVALLLAAQAGNRRAASTTPSAARALFTNGLTKNPPRAVKAQALAVLSRATPDCKTPEASAAKIKTTPAGVDWEAIVALIKEYTTTFISMKKASKPVEGARLEGAEAEGAKVEGAKVEGAKVEGAKAEDDPVELVAISLLAQIGDALVAFERAHVKAVSNMPDVPIGNEFTFTDAAMAKVVDGSKKEEDVELAMKKPYEAALKRWEDAMRKRGFEPVRSKYAGHPSLIYQFPDADGWKYEVTRDQGCVEVVTAPTTASSLHGGAVADIVDQCIFAVAADAQLYAHATIGGGHINIDRAAAFNEDPAALVRFIEAFYNDADYWKKEDPDAVNAPFPDEHSATQRDAIYEVIRRFRAASSSPSPWTMDHLADELLKCFTENLAGKPERQSPHYQALNFEHMNDKDPGARRVEVRRVPAQRDRAHLLEHLHRIGGLLGAAKGSD